MKSALFLSSISAAWFLPDSNDFSGDEFIQLDLPFRNETDDLNQLLKSDKHGYQVVQLDDDSSSLL